jgi:ribosomal protein S24E
MSETIADFKNNLMKRREVKMIMESDTNPSMESAKELVAKDMGVAVENVVIKLVKGKFGTNSFLVEALVYDNADVLKQIEPVIKKKVAK